MTKTIFALGGGTFGEHRETYTDWSLPLPFGQNYYDATTTPVDKLIVQATHKPTPKVLLILTASEDGHTNLDLLVAGFRMQYEDLGAQVDTLKLITERPSSQEIKSKIEWADAIYVSGGNTYRMMRTWRRLGVDKLLRQAYDKGTVVSGMSAGSICWFRYGTSDSFYSGTSESLIRVNGMDWHKLLICPHFDTEPYRQPAMKRIMKRTPSVMGIALDEHAALEITDDTYRIHIFKEGSHVQKCYWKDATYHTKQIELKRSYSPLDELLSS